MGLMLCPMPGARCRHKDNAALHGFVRSIAIPESPDGTLKVEAKVEWLVPWGSSYESGVPADAIEALDEPDAVWGKSPVAGCRIWVESVQLDPTAVSNDTSYLTKPGD